MGVSSWPSPEELDVVRTKVAEMSGADAGDVRVVVAPYRICPLGAHIDHQGGTVTAMTIKMGILLGYVPSHDGQVLLRSGQFQGKVRFRVDEPQCPERILNEPDWARFPRGALYALQSKGHHLTKGIIGFICGSEEHSSGLSSSAAVGIAYLLAFEKANFKTMSPEDNIEFDRLIENEYLKLKNGILDQSAILLSKYGYLTWMDCKIRKNDAAYFPEMQKGPQSKQATYKILLAFSGLKEPLMRNSGYNTRVSECKEAAEILLGVGTNAFVFCVAATQDEYMTACLMACAIKQSTQGPKCICILLGNYTIRGPRSQYEYLPLSAGISAERHSSFACAAGNGYLEPLLCNVDPVSFEVHKDMLKPNLAKRAFHYFSENERVKEGLKAWTSGNLDDFGKLMSASGRSSIENYECGCTEMIDLYEILLKAPGVYGARFSGAGFRGCCLALVDADLAVEAADFVKREYTKAQPVLACRLPRDKLVLICEPGDSAHVI